MAPTATSLNGRRKSDELTASRFCVQLQEVIVATFRECSGLNGEVEIETYREGGLNAFEYKLPGRVKYGNITLKSGVISITHLWDWFEKVSLGDIKFRDLSIVLMTQTYEEQIRWDLQGAYPVKWSGPDFTAGDANIAVQTLELAHHGIKQIKK